MESPEQSKAIEIVDEEQVEYREHSNTEKAQSDVEKVNIYQAENNEHHKESECSTHKAENETLMKTIEAKTVAGAEADGTAESNDACVSENTSQEQCKTEDGDDKGNTQTEISVEEPTAKTVSSVKYEADPEALRNLIVNYLPPLMDENQLYQLFLQFGPIESVKIIFDKQTHESRGYGFVKYYFFFSATYAIACLNRFSISGKKLKVAYAHAENAKSALATVKQLATGFTPPQQLAYSNMYYGQMAFMQRESNTTIKGQQIR